MRVAIPLFGTRIAPRFDCADEFLVANVSAGAVVERGQVTVAGLAPVERAKRLCELGVDTVVCGGIDQLSASYLAGRGLAVYAWVTGEADDALDGLLLGELEPLAMMGAGGHCRGRWRFRHRRGLSTPHPVVPNPTKQNPQPKHGHTHGH